MRRPKFYIKKAISAERWKRYQLTGLSDFEGIKTKRTKADIAHEWDYPPRIHEEVVCKVFGCGRKLTLREQLFGDCCRDHQEIIITKSESNGTQDGEAF